jgi:hypothetical protein
MNYVLPHEGGVPRTRGERTADKPGSQLRETTLGARCGTYKVRVMTIGGNTGHRQNRDEIIELVEEKDREQMRICCMGIG